MLPICLNYELPTGSEAAPEKHPGDLEEFKKRLIEVQKEPFSVRDLKIDGNDVMKELNLKPGPKVGEILKYLFLRKWSKRNWRTEKSALLKRLKNLSQFTLFNFLVISSQVTRIGTATNGDE